MDTMYFDHVYVLLCFGNPSLSSSLSRYPISTSDFFFPISAAEKGMVWYIVHQRMVCLSGTTVPKKTDSPFHSSLQLPIAH